jgi:hypothetical protein
VKIKENIVQGIKANNIIFLFNGSEGKVILTNDFKNNNNKAHKYNNNKIVI